MASEMPERIWVIPDDPAAKGFGEYYGDDRYLPDEKAEYIRADLAVPATTHQLTLEALREAEKALVKVRSVVAYNIAAFQSLDPDALGIGESEDYGQWAIRDEMVHHCNEGTVAIDAALARIKEATCPTT